MSFLDDFLSDLNASDSSDGSRGSDDSGKTGGDAASSRNARTPHSFGDFLSTVFSGLRSGESSSPRPSSPKDGGASSLPPRLPKAGRGSGKGGDWGRRVMIVVGVLLALALVILLLARFGTDVLWYDQVGFQSVIWTNWAMRAGLWVLYAFLVGGVGYLSLNLAVNSRPAGSDGVSFRLSSNGKVLEERQSVSSGAVRRAGFWVCVLIGLFLGSRLVSHWNEFLLLFHAQSFGTRDPQFGLDVGFYVFVLPALRAIVGGLLTLVIVGLVVCALVQLAMSGIRLRMPRGGRGILTMTPRARRQLGVWSLLVFLLWGAQVALDAFESLTSGGERFTGADYTAVHAGIPVTFAVAAFLVLFGVLLCAWLCATHRFDDLATGPVAFREAFRAWKTPLIAGAVLAVLALVLQVVYPAVLQSLVVNPNQQELESAYIQRNIDATRAAFDLGGVKTDTYRASTTGQAGQLSTDAETTAQIRLLDPQVVSPTFRQLQQSKQYYTFADILAVDKYKIRGKSYDTVIGARELNLAGNDNRNWVNDHTVYTHGYGVVAAYGNRVSRNGEPLFFEKGIPTQGMLTQTEHYEPRIYFSPNAPDYSIVGHPAGRADWEFDYPSGSNGVRNEFRGNGGPRTSNWFVKLLYAICFGSDQIFFSDRVTPDSQILYYRSPIERVRRVAPYLELDSRVYPAVVDGRVKWVVDAYTVSDQYPYSQKVDLHSSTQDALTQSSRSMRTLTTGEVNYMRNSVKATVDAYDGHVDLYAWDPSDPILRAWEKVFPGQYKPVSRISGDLMSHMRYPESLFKVQRQLLGRYHVGTASQFFSGEDFWQTPTDPTVKSGSRGVLQPPYYLTMQVPRRTTPTFSLSTSYIPAGSETREILMGFLAADSDAGHTKGVIGPNYGTLRLLELPKNTNVPGPGQAQNNFNADASVSRELNLLETGSTEVVRGNLLTLPIGHGLVYVQPVYVQSSGSTKFPLLKKVLVAFGEHIGFADTLDEALDQIFGGNSGAAAGDAANSRSTRSKVSAPDVAGPTGERNAGAGAPARPGAGAGHGAEGAGEGNPTLEVPNASRDVQNALNDADSALADSDAALRKGDFSAYGKAQDRLKQAIRRAVESSQGTSRASVPSAGTQEPGASKGSSSGK